MPTNENQDYVLRIGEVGAKRLRLLARVKWPTTKPLLQRVGVRQGMRCLDVGCGSGAVTLKLALWVGPKGQAVGIDRDERCLELARQKASRHNLNAVFRAESVTDLQDESLYDLVFSRFLLTHLSKPDDALKKMVRACRPGGTLVAEDIEFSAHFCYPACAAFDRYVNLYQQAVAKRGGDPNIGPRLLSLFLDAGLAQVDLEVIQPSFRTGPGKHMAPVTMAHIQESVVNAGLASEEEVQSIVSELEQFAENPRTILSLPRIFQVWGRKPQ